MCSPSPLVTRPPLRQLKGLTSTVGSACSQPFPACLQPSDLFGFFPINERTTKLPGARSIHHSARDSAVLSLPLRLVLPQANYCDSAPLLFIAGRSPSSSSCVYSETRERESRCARRLQSERLLFHYHLFSAPVSLVKNCEGLRLVSDAEMSDVPRDTAMPSPTCSLTRQDNHRLLTRVIG